MNHARLRIGDWVLVSHVRKPSDARMETKHPYDAVFARSVVRTPIVECWGQICGARRMALGYTHMGNEDCGSYFISTKFETFWLVRFGLLNKPVVCAEEDFRPMTEEERASAVKGLPRLPLIKQDQRPWNKRWREELRNEMRSWPRDEKGRWVRKLVTNEEE